MPITMGRTEDIRESRQKHNSGRNFFPEILIGTCAKRMREYFNTVIGTLAAGLEGNAKQSDPIRRNVLAMELVKEAFQQLQEHFIEKYGDRDVPAYISANRDLFPAILSQYLFHELS